MKEDLKNIIKRTVDNHSDDINPDMIWSGIESKLGQKKRKNFAGYWWVSGLSLIAAVLIYAFAWSTEDSVHQSSVVNYATTNEVDEGVITSEGEDDVKFEDNIVVVERSKQVENGKEEEINLNDSKIELSNRLPQNLESVIQEYKSSVINQESPLLNSSITNIEKSVESIENNLTVSQAAKDSRQVNVLNVNRDRESLSIAKVKLIMFNRLNVDERVVKLTDYEEFVFDYPYVASESNFNFLSGIELYGGFSLGDKSVSDVNQTYAQSRNDSEKLLEQWSAGVRFDLVKVMDFQLQSGVRYSMITDRLQMDNEYKDLPEYTYTKSRLIDGAIVVIDNVMVMDSSGQTIRYITEQYNSQRLISIPLEVSFGKRLGRFDLGLGFGIDINYQLSDTHVILGVEGQPSVNRVGGKWVSPSFSGALLAAYHLNDKWSINSRMNFRGLTLSDHESITTLRSTYKLYGIELGLKRNFGN